MAVPFAGLSLLLSIFFFFLIISHLPQRSYTNPTCHPFDCGNLANIQFPFYNASISHTCGKYPISCKDNIPTLGYWELSNYLAIKSISYAEKTLIVQDLKFLNQLRDCHELSNVFDPTTINSLYLVHGNPILTVYNCKHHMYIPPSVPRIDLLYNYTRCGGYDLFYTQDVAALPGASIPYNCTVFLTSMRSSSYLGGYYSMDDLLSILDAGYSLQWDSNQGLVSPSSTGGRNGISKSGRMKIALGLSAAVSSILIAIVLIFLRRGFSSCNVNFMFWNTKTNPTHKVEEFLKNYGALTIKRYKYSDIKKMTNNFKVKVGEGGFGGVFKGKLHDSRPVAVKVLSKTKGDGEEFMNEVASIGRTYHVNIVTLLGFCSEGSKRALIYEFMPNGSLEKFIYNSNSSTPNSLGWEKLDQIALGIAGGLEYLHRGCNMRILHLDIKPHNILLDEDFCPKIADFGLAKLCTAKESIISMVGARGTVGYIAPEVYCRNIGRVSYKSDVYSYGMMVLEMVGGRKNIELGVGKTSEIYFPDWAYKHLILHGDLGLDQVMTEAEQRTARKMIVVGLWCIQTDPTNRPSMNKVVEMLEGNLEGLQMPPNPFLSPSQQDSSTPIP